MIITTEKKRQTRASFKSRELKLNKDVNKSCFRGYPSTTYKKYFKADKGRNLIAPSYNLQKKTAYLEVTTSIFILFICREETRNFNFSTANSGTYFFLNETNE